MPPQIRGNELLLNLRTMPQLLSRLIRFGLSLSLLCWCAVVNAQLGVIVITGQIPDTCKALVRGPLLGVSEKVLVLVPRQEFTGFDVHGRDTTFNYSPGSLNQRYRVCYKIYNHASPNCPWLYREEHLITNCP